MRENRTGRILREGGVALGLMVFDMATTGVGRLAAGSGADFVLLDLEHTGWSVDGLRPVLAAMRADDVTPLVRVPSTVPHLISGSLDAGALGVMVPMVGGDRQAAEAARAARFPPEGARGFGLPYPDQQHPDGVAATMRAANDETLVIVQIETLEGLERAPEIAAVPGVDVLWVGQYDLANSMGVPGRFDDPRMEAANERVVQACAEHGRAAGMLAAGADHAEALIASGFRCVAVATDVGLVHDGLTRALARARGGDPTEPG